MDMKQEAMAVWEKFLAFKESIDDLSAKYKNIDTEYKVDGMADTLIDYKFDLADTLNDVFGLTIGEEEE